MIPLYILGFLLRYGPQHGYQIKKMISEQLADFTSIKLPTIYYHLEKMEAAGLIAATQCKEGVRPEKRIYSVSSLGADEFKRLLSQTLDICYRPTFDVDSALFFSDSVEDTAFVTAFETHAGHLKESLARIEKHRGEVIPYLPPDMRPAANLIFQHHELHYRAELAWAEKAIQTMKEGINRDETQKD